MEHILQIIDLSILPNFCAIRNEQTSTDISL